MIVLFVGGYVAWWRKQYLIAATCLGLIFGILLAAYSTFFLAHK